MMQGKARFFASLREVAGRSEWDWELEEGATVGTLLADLCARSPGLEAEVERAWIAVNRRYATPDRQLEDGDEVAFFPPVSGG
ncbi:MAG: molybdopterin converting factor subunit 1 [Anaerolineae bacterium]